MRNVFPLSESSLNLGRVSNIIYVRLQYFLMCKHGDTADSISVESFGTCWNPDRIPEATLLSGGRQMWTLKYQPKYLRAISKF